MSDNPSTIYLVDDDGPGVARANSRTTADALIRVAGFRKVSREEYRRVQRRIREQEQRAIAREAKDG